MDFRGRVAALFQTIDVLLIPVHPFPPATLAMIQTLGEQPELISKLQRFTRPFDLTGNPTVTLPGGFTHRGLAVGFQLFRRRFARGNAGSRRPCVSESNILAPLASGPITSPE
jgi:Asp-tRNA(Asn)/Glu-tRNA(Gln) amidotransferase A subunit family amidase